jgi:hypothetical protein
MTQSETPQAPWTPPASGESYQPQPEAKKSGAKKWAGLAGTVAVVGVGAAYSLTGGFGLGDPKIGDCVQMKGETSFEVVDCGSAEAEYKVVGIEEEEMTYAEFEADMEACSGFPSTEYVLWTGDVMTEPGTVTCAEPV